jgi:hypothetical protein
MMDETVWAVLVSSGGHAGEWIVWIARRLSDVLKADVLKAYYQQVNAWRCKSNLICDRLHYRVGGA